jgi:hypothetical protein
MSSRITPAIDAAGGGFMMHYATVAVTAKRADAHTQQSAGS